MPARANASFTAMPPSSGAEKLARAPLNFPMGVRADETITDPGMTASQVAATT